MANLNSASKIFEKLILQRITEIEQEMKVDLTGKNQHGFKRGKSTKTACIEIQSALSRALDKGNFALLASIDLSAALDLVNMNLLI